MLEVDSGLGRCGVLPGESLLNLARHVSWLKGLRVVGIFTYRGYRSDLEAAGREQGEIMVREAERLRRAGIAVEEVSVGSTPTGRSAGRVPGVTEIRPGTYVFNDAMQVRWGSALPEECALTVLARVISRPSAGVAVLDAGKQGPHRGAGTIQQSGRQSWHHLGLSRLSDRPAVGRTRTSSVDRGRPAAARRRPRTDHPCPCLSNREPG
jgi:D-serine deaminase-like pyridoxal phosphate-dependent protein